MTTDRSKDSFVSLVRELCTVPRETEWVEFKANNSNPVEIGEYISALANSAALLDKLRAYVLWAVEDGTRNVIGTTFDPATVKQGNENLENWVTRLLQPQIPFRFHACEVDGARVVLLEIDRALHQPVRFSGEEYIRVGSYKKKLKDHPEKGDYPQLNFLA